jgi:uncharacterized membrane protein
MSSDPTSDREVDPAVNSDVEIIVPPSTQTYSADTSNDELRRVGVQVTRELYSGPIPDPRTLKALAEVYPDAPKVIFEDFKAQAKHRRALEERVIEKDCKAALRGQIIGGIVGCIGLATAGVFAVAGYPAFGIAIVGLDLFSLVSLFVTGHVIHARERVQKTKIREMLKRDHPVDEIESLLSNS